MNASQYTPLAKEVLTPTPGFRARETNLASQTRSTATGLRSIIKENALNPTITTLPFPSWYTTVREEGAGFTIENRFCGRSRNP